MVHNIWLRGCDCNVTGGCVKCRSFFISFPLPQQPKNVTVFVTREELNRHGYDWLYCDKPHDPIQVQGILCA
jgi:hypothetical protein